MTGCALAARIDFVPEGRFENSPAIYRWGWGEAKNRSPVGTTEIPGCNPNQPSLRDFWRRGFVNPAMNRWAIIGCPSGTASPACGGLDGATMSNDTLGCWPNSAVPVTQTCHILLLGQEILTTEDTKDTKPESQCPTNQALVTLVSLVVKMCVHNFGCGLAAPCSPWFH